MAWIFTPTCPFSPEPAGLISARALREASARSATSSATDTRKRSSKPKSEAAGLMKPQPGTTSQHSTECPGVEAWISSVVASRAKTSVSLVREPASSRGTAPGSGTTLRESFAKFNPGASLSKMSSDFSHLERFTANSAVTASAGKRKKNESLTQQNPGRKAMSRTPVQPAIFAAGLWTSIERLIYGMGRVLGDLAELGYDAEWGVWGASAVGAKHIRKRIFLLAYSRKIGRARREECDGEETKGERQTSFGGDVDGCVDSKRGHGDASHGDVADTDKVRWDGGAGEQREGWGRQSSDGGDAMADAAGEGWGPPGGHEQAAEGSGEEAGQPTSRDWWAVEPDVGRVVNGVAFRVDRLSLCQCLSFREPLLFTHPAFQA